MYFCAGCISGPSASMRSRTDLLIGSGVITAVRPSWPPVFFASFARFRALCFFCAEGAGTGAADRFGSNIAARDSVTRYALLAKSLGRSGKTLGTGPPPEPPFAPSSPSAFSFARSSVSATITTASRAFASTRDTGETLVAAAAATICARARASSSARRSSAEDSEPRVASSRFPRLAGSSSAGLEAIAGPADGLGVGETASLASSSAGANDSGVSGTADESSGEPMGGGAGELLRATVAFSTSSANASKSYGSTVTSTRSALRFFPASEARVADVDDGSRVGGNGSSSASGLILRASAISSSCSSGSASRRLRLVFGGITGVSGAFREARRRSSAPLVAAANPPTTLLVSEPLLDRLFRSERF